MDKSKFNIKAEWKKFGIGLFVISSLIGTLQLILENELYIYFFSLAATLLVISLFIPLFLKPLYILFSYIGFGMGWVMTRVILTLLYYLVFTPIGIIRKLAGKSFLDIKFERKENTYWIDKKTGNNIKSFEKQF